MKCIETDMTQAKLGENEEIRQIGLSDSKLRYLVQTVCLVTIGAFDMLRKRVVESEGVSADKIKETVCQTIPYIGFPAVKPALGMSSMN